MKAKINATGEIVEEELKGFDNLNVEHYIINGNQNWILSEFSLEFLESGSKLNYWTRLEHQYAGMFLQAQISYGEQEGLNTEEMVEDAMIYAHALIQKLKEKGERK